MVMAHFAKIDENDIVTQVIVVEPDVIDSGLFGDPQQWIQTSYNNNIRKWFAGIGYKYDREKDIFIPPKPYNSWVYDEDIVNWKAPIEYPLDGTVYMWNEQTVSWKPLEENE